MRRLQSRDSRRGDRKPKLGTLYGVKIGAGRDVLLPSVTMRTLWPDENGEVPVVRLNTGALLRHAGRVSDSNPTAAAELGDLAAIIRGIDLTTLSGDDTPARVHRLAERGCAPLSGARGAVDSVAEKAVQVAAVCVYPEMVPFAQAGLTCRRVAIAAVAGGFPAGLTPLAQRLDEVAAVVDAGANEIDVVLRRYLVLNHDWLALRREIEAFREAASNRVLKVILSVGDIADLADIYRASRVALDAGADFIKTSTGKEPVNANIPAGLSMLRALRDHHTASGLRCGFKPAGGISNVQSARAWRWLVAKELDAEWLEPETFRIGASSLLDDVVARVEAAAGRAGVTERRPSQNP